MPDVDCPYCGGSGKKLHINLHHSEMIPCPHCRGSGKIMSISLAPSLEYNSSGFLDELTNLEKEPIDFYEAGMVQAGDPRGYTPDQSDVKATGHGKYINMAEKDYFDDSYKLTNKDYEDEYNKGNMREAVQYPNPKYHDKTLEELLQIKEDYFSMGGIGNTDLGDDPDTSDYDDLMWEIGFKKEEDAIKQGKYGHKESVEDDDESDYEKDKKLRIQGTIPYRNSSKKVLRSLDGDEGITDTLKKPFSAFGSWIDRNSAEDGEWETKGNEHDIPLEQEQMIPEINEEEETLQSLKTQYTIDTLKGDMKNLKLEQDKQDARIIMDEIVHEEILPIIDQLKTDIVQGIQSTDQVGNDEIKAMQEESHMCNDCMGKAYENLAIELDCPDCDMDLSSQDRLERHQDKAHSNQPSNTWKKDNTWNQYRDKQMKKENEALNKILNTKDTNNPYWTETDDILVDSIDNLEMKLTEDEFQDSARLKKAIEIAKRSDPDEYVCSKCDFKTMSKEEYEDHKITHDDYYMKQGETISHLQETHKMCGGCNEAFLTKAKQVISDIPRQSANKRLANAKASGLQTISTTCSECGATHEDKFVTDNNDWSRKHKDETGHLEYVTFFINSGNEWVPIGRNKKNARPSHKTQNKFVGDMIEAD